MDLANELLCRNRARHKECDGIKNSKHVVIEGGTFQWPAELAPLVTIAMKKIGGLGRFWAWDSALKFEERLLLLLKHSYRHSQSKKQKMFAGCCSTVAQA